MTQAITLDEVWKLFKETDRKFQETDRKFQDTERLLKEKSLETERKFQEMERAFEKQNRELSKKLGELGNRLGDFIEEMVKPAAVRLFREWGIQVHRVYQNMTASVDGDGIEIDLLLVNQRDLVGVECKSSVGVEEVKEHIKRLGKIKKLFPEYAEMRIMGAVAGMVFSDSAERYAMKHGLFVIKQSGEAVTLANDPQFKPCVW
jgi:hypothetical protein